MEKVWSCPAVCASGAPPAICWGDSLARPAPTAWELLLLIPLPGVCGGVVRCPEQLAALEAGGRLRAFPSKGQRRPAQDPSLQPQARSILPCRMLSQSFSADFGFHIGSSQRELKRAEAEPLPRHRLTRSRPSIRTRCCSQEQVRQWSRSRPIFQKLILLCGYPAPFGKTRAFLSNEVPL